VLAEGLDCFDRASSSEVTMMALQRFDKAGRRVRLAAYRREKCVTIRPLYNHTLMFIQQPTRTLDGKIAGGESGHGHSLLDDSLRRWRYAKFESLRLVFSFRRRRVFSRGRHEHAPDFLYGVSPCVSGPSLFAEDMEIGGCDAA
jgi:hypothetical protein